MQCVLRGSVLTVFSSMLNLVLSNMCLDKTGAIGWIGRQGSKQGSVGLYLTASGKAE